VESSLPLGRIAGVEIGVNRSVVLDDGQVVGILAAADLGRALEARPHARRAA